MPSAGRVHADRLLCCEASSMSVTEQADVARLLFSEASHPHCVGFSLLQWLCQRPKSGDGVKAHSPRQGQGLQDAEDERQSLLVPLKGKQYGGRRVRDKRQTQRGSGKLKCTLTQKTEHRVSAKHS